MQDIAIRAGMEKKPAESSGLEIYFLKEIEETG
jgi:hypothetical protein